MSAALAALAATALPAETLTVLADGPSDGGEGFTPTNVTPGVTGFIVVFLIGAATVLLIVDMTRRIRRIQARERVAERHRLEAERIGDEDVDGGAAGAGKDDGEAPQDGGAAESDRDDDGSAAGPDARD
ncbi:hypothetical protein [Brachybacterium nesterenkovii]|uniref:hypothetical protein n=1 Tax=Brachybacterium nesterenkovii TaxID=47847 RepID=UPI00321A5830